MIPPDFSRWQLLVKRHGREPADGVRRDARGRGPERAAGHRRGAQPRAAARLPRRARRHRRRADLPRGHHRDLLRQAVRLRAGRGPDHARVLVDDLPRQDARRGHRERARRADRGAARHRRRLRPGRRLRGGAAGADPHASARRSTASTPTCATRRSSASSAPAASARRSRRRSRATTTTSPRRSCCRIIALVALGEWFSDWVRRRLR